MQLEKMEYYGREFMADIRRVRDMESVICDRKWAISNPDLPLYYMFRGVYRNEADMDIMKSLGIRYDITIIPPVLIGKEFNKTFGHRHPKAKNSMLSYTEIYEVLEGKAHYLLQKPRPGSGDEIEDVIVIEAGAGDSVIVPPDYAHITINPSSETLKMANLVFSGFSSDYSGIVKHGGGSYFEFSDGSWVKNSSYPSLPAIRFMKPNTGFGKDIYNLIKTPQNLVFLREPEKTGQFIKWNSFQK